MRAAQLTELLQEVKSALERIYGENLRGVYLYGSYAKSQEDPESDVDIMIVLKDFSDYWQEVQRTGGLIAALSLRYNRSISPVRIREAEWAEGDSPFVNVVRKEAIPVASCPLPIARQNPNRPDDETDEEWQKGGVMIGMQGGE